MESNIDNFISLFLFGVLDYTTILYSYHNEVDFSLLKHVIYVIHRRALQ